jgi:iron complex outermembrane receptor protein
MRQIAEPRIPFGVTGQAYACPFDSGDSRSDLCLTGNRQYNVFREGNAALQPEESEQFSIGAVYAPSNEFSISVDYWDLELENQVERPTQQNIFSDQVRYSELFTSRFDEGRQRDVLAVIQGPINIGESNTSGVDWTMNITNDFSWATLRTQLAGTYVIESESLRVGTTDVFDTSLGRKGPDEEVVFRNRARIVNTLVHGDFSHTINVAYHSGYTDQAFPGGSRSIRVADPETGGPTTTRYSGGVQLRVASHTIIDWSSTWYYNDSLNLTLGANNLTDKLPPLAFGEGGGHQEGFDPRYFDSYGRTFYLRGEY